MSVFDSTIANLLTNDRVQAAQAFNAVADAISWDTGVTASRSAGTFGKDAKGNAYSFSQFLVSRFSAIKLAYSRTHTSESYVLLAKVLDEPVAVMVTGHGCDSEVPVGSATVTSKNQSTAVAALANMIELWNKH